MATAHARTGSFLLPLILLLAGFLTDQVHAAELAAKGRLSTIEGVPAGQVTVLLEVSDMRIRRQVAYLRTESAADGTFSFDLDAYSEMPQLGLQFGTSSPRYRKATKIVVVAQEELPVAVDLVLEPGSVAKGRVVDDLGNAVPGAEVSAPGTDSVTTGDSGEFEIFGLPANGGTSITAARQGFVEKTEQVQSAGPSLIEGIEIVLTPASGLEGVVLDPEGKPLHPALVMIRLEGQVLHKLVDKQGHFDFRAVPEDLAKYEVVVNSDAFLFEPRKFTPEEATSRNVTLRTSWPVRLAGRLLDSSGAPFSGGQILTGDGRSERPRTFPISMDGEWAAFPFEPGQEVLLTALPPEPEQRQDSGELDFTLESSPGQWKAEVDPWPRGYSSVFEATLTGNSITMTRKDTGLGGLPGTVTYQGTIDSAFSMMEGTMSIPSLKAKGTFRARAYLPNGTLRGVWDLRERVEEGEYLAAPVQKKVTTAPFTGTQYIKMQMTEPLELRGKVLDANGAPVIEGLVYVASWNGSQILNRSGKIAAGGEFHLQGLPQGILQLIALDASGQMVAPPALARGGITNLVIEPEPGPDPMDPVAPPQAK